MQHNRLVYVFCAMCGPGASHPSILAVQHASVHVQGAWESCREAAVLIWHVLHGHLPQNVLDLGHKLHPFRAFFDSEKRL